ncbi:MAG: RNA-splicing ligase RtcB [Candidatus Rokubacteria bacterium RIFCSPLOWO2_02_FULL_73_56]|nr:MAG: RNA-splicing ligase RtcB [Candidatus Rokubacteria bacterium RIFCSPLOWO2_02_FULL_73_56]OGL21405.1 MAG: RNA-splicing ligase RtcB [Candidatus Rokubacteria bacterium RIFCSPLOWO2_12_FULL_73_47]
MKTLPIADCVWEIPPSEKPGMRVPARIYASQALLGQMDQGVFEQVTNVACLPGIVRASLCMPDGHWGYGFPIGGVAAFRADTGVISPGGIGFDINCGMRVLRTRLTEAEVRPKLRELVDALFAAVPSGVGAHGFVRLTEDELREVMREGSGWCVRRGYGWPEDLAATEGGGCLPGADPEQVSVRAITRGIGQLGTLGSGNHYLEIQVVPPDGVHDAAVARAFGVTGPGQVLVMLHCGSRGFGHQVGTDYLRRFDQAMHAYGISVPDRELACAPFRSPEGQAYFGAMTAAANTAFANRQVITHRVREVLGRIFGRDPRELGLEVVYDVCHNTAKLERHVVDGAPLDLVVHRKGATRAFGPGAPDVPAAYRDVGQPVIIGGSMETGSALLVGTAHAMEETFGSTAHGAGRTMSRAQARKRVWGETLIEQLGARGIVVRAASKSGVAEEAGFAYKDLAEVVEVVHRLDVSRRVVSLRPIGNIKG